MVPESEGSSLACCLSHRIIPRLPNINGFKGLSRDLGSYKIYGFGTALETSGIVTDWLKSFRYSVPFAFIFIVVLSVSP